MSLEEPLDWPSDESERCGGGARRRFGIGGNLRQMRVVSNNVSLLPHRSTKVSLQARASERLVLGAPSIRAEHRARNRRRQGTPSRRRKTSGVRIRGDSSRASMTRGSWSRTSRSIILIGARRASARVDPRPAQATRDLAGVELGIPRTFRQPENLCEVQPAARRRSPVQRRPCDRCGRL